jgi:uncharacterized protein YbbC (DUF1343 family)
MKVLSDLTLSPAACLRPAGKKLGLLCHSSSIASDYRHITEIFGSSNECSLAASWPPARVSGQTQDNMIEWESTTDPILGIPVYSLYGTHRKPTPDMLEALRSLVLISRMSEHGYTHISGL